MIIVKGIPFLLPAGKSIGTAQLAGKKEHIFQKVKLSNVFICLISVRYTVKIVSKFTTFYRFIVLNLSFYRCRLPN